MLTHPAKAQRSKTANREEQASSGEDLYQPLEVEEWGEVETDKRVWLSL